MKFNDKTYMMKYMCAVTVAGSILFTGPKEHADYGRKLNELNNVWGNLI